MAPTREAGSFKVTVSFIAATIAAVAALAVMIGAIVFIRGEDEPAKTQAFSALTAPRVDVAPLPPARPIIGDAKLATVVLPAADAKPVADVKPVVDAKPVADTKPVGDAKKTTKKKAPVVAQAEEEEEPAAPPPTKKKTSKPSDKEAERLLADLQEQQLKR